MTNMILKHYLHQDGDMSEIIEGLSDVELNDRAKEHLAEQIYNFFYEVEFELDVEEVTGNITSVTMVRVGRKLY